VIQTKYPSDSQYVLMTWEAGWLWNHLRGVSLVYTCPVYHSVQYKKDMSLWILYGGRGGLVLVIVYCGGDMAFQDCGV